MKYLEHKIISRVDDIKDIKEGRFPVPRSLTIYPSEVCNLKCIGCHSTGIHKNNGFLSFKRFKEVIDDFSEMGGKAIAFEGGGEPMLTPDISKMFKYADKIGLEIGVITNGTVYKPEMLLAKWIRVSMFAPTERIYNKATRSNKYYFVLSNIKKMLKERVKTRIGIKFLASKKYSNYKNIDKKFSFVDYVQIKNLRNSEDSMIKNPKFVKPCGLTPLKAVMDYDGSFYACPFFHHCKDTKIESKLISCYWGTKEHKKVISKITNCNLYDCPMLGIDYEFINKLDLNFI